MRHWRSGHRCHIAAGTAIHWSFSMRITSSKTLGSGAPQPQSTIAKTPRTNIRLNFSHISIAPSPAQYNTGGLDNARTNLGVPTPVHVVALILFPYRWSCRSFHLDTNRRRMPSYAAGS